MELAGFISQGLGDPQVTWVTPGSGAHWDAPGLNREVAGLQRRLEWWAEGRDGATPNDLRFRKDRSPLSM